jgi:hypothetical protein
VVALDFVEVALDQLAAAGLEVLEEQLAAWHLTLRTRPLFAMGGSLADL